MKRFLLGLLIIVGLVVVALGVFLATFDADRYRPLVVQRLQDTLGTPVSLEHLSVGFDVKPYGEGLPMGLNLRLDGLRIEAVTEQQKEPLFSAESIKAFMRLLPLLKKELQLVSLEVIRPKIQFMRDAQGKINLQGLLPLAAPVASASPKVVDDLPIGLEISSFHIEEGTLSWMDAATQPPMMLQVNALEVTVPHLSFGDPIDLDASGMLQVPTQPSAEVELPRALSQESPNLRMHARLILPNATQPGSIEGLTFTLDEMTLERLIPAPHPGDPQVRGKLSLHLEGHVPTLSPNQLLQMCSATGTLRMQEPVIANLNILRTVFGRLSMLPGLLETLATYLPPEAQAAFATPDTRLEPFELAIRFQNGALWIPELALTSEHLGLVGEGKIGLDGSLDLPLILRIRPPLASHIVKSVNRLAVLVNTEGMMEIPILIGGRVGQVKVSPDIQAVTQKILVPATEELIGTLLQKILE